MSNIRTDLALEATELYKKERNEQIPGVSVEEDKSNEGIFLNRVNIKSLIGEQQIGKAKGMYITIDAPDLKERDPEFEHKVSQTLANEINRLVNINKNFTTLIVGLGNWNITPDSLGPKVVSRMMVTRHLIQMIPDQVDERVTSVCAVAPGVLGITGIETGEIIIGIVQKVKPDLVIAIDALASRKSFRIGTTIQLSDTGISPGSGIGNKRMALNKESLGIPVIAIGVPLVVYASTIAQDIIGLIRDEYNKKTITGNEFLNMLGGANQDYLNQLVGKVVSNNPGDLVVTPKEIDILVESISRVLSDGLNLALHKGVNLDEIHSFIN